jgi:hypothetical protein
MRFAGVSASLAVRMSFSRRIGTLAVDQQSGALVGVGDHAIADNDALAGLELDFQGHGRFLEDGI